VATYLVESYSVDTERSVLRYNESDGTGIYEELQADADLNNLKTASGVDVGTDRRRVPNVNVSIINSSAIEGGTRAPAERGADSENLAWGPNTGDRTARRVRPGSFAFPIRAQVQDSLLADGEGVVTMDRAQAYTLEGTIAAIVVVLAVFYGLQAVDTGPWSGDSDREPDQLGTQAADF